MYSITTIINIIFLIREVGNTDMFLVFSLTPVLVSEHVVGKESPIHLGYKIYRHFVNIMTGINTPEYFLE